MYKQSASFFSLLSAIGILLVGTVGTAHAQAKQLYVRGTLQHINGVNLPWMTNSGGSNYGHDIGPNHYTNYGYDYVSSDVDSYYADISNMRANIVRVWLTEGLQGLTFGSNGHITGIDPTFLTNLKDMVRLANKHGLALELTLTTNSDFAQNGYPAGGGGQLVNWVTDSSAQTDFLNNVVKPLTQTFDGNPGVYGYDIMNECNYAVSSGYCSWPQLHSYIYNVAQAIHSVDSSIQVTCSTDDVNSFVTGNFYNRVGGIGLDYYDYHNYSDTPNLFSLGSGGPYPQIDKPIVLAEYGARTENNWTIQNTVTGNFISQASDLGWAGASAWSYDASGQSGYSLVYGIGNWHTAAYTLQSYSIEHGIGGSPSPTHVLWTNTNGIAALWNYTPSTGAFIATNFGPYPNWNAKAIADGGTDAKTRLLWTNTNGTAALWNVTATTGAFIATNFGPYSGWTAKAVSVGSDNTTHILWNNTNGTAALWNVTGGVYQSEHDFGPYSGWTAQALADGPDGKTQLLWTNAGGQAALWSVTSATGAFSQFSFGPYTGWTAKAISAGATTTHVLWSNTNGMQSVWNYTPTSGAFTAQSYGPYSGWSANALADGSDGQVRLLWANINGTASFWSADNATGLFSQFSFGPYAGWTVQAVSAGN